MITSLVWKATFHRLNAQRYWAEWDRFDRLPPGQQRDVIAGRLLETLRYFGTRSDAFPEWRELAASGSSDAVWEHWTSLPIVTKKDLQQTFDADEIRDRYAINGRIDTSGGSTGVPSRFLWDTESLHERAVMQYYCWLKLGWKPGLPILSLWGAPRDLGQSSSPKANVRKKLQKLYMVDGYEFGEQTVRNALEVINSHKQIAVYGYTTLLEQFAREVLDQGINVGEGRVYTSWSGAEPLRDEQSELFRSVFGVPIHNQYGGREFGAIGYKLDGAQSFNLFRTSVYLEIVNDDNKPCAPGETGRILLTTLNGRGTPFIRYENGDMGTYADFDMTEAGLIGITSVDGRTSSLIRLPNGKTFHSVFWHQLLKDYQEIKSFHVHQTADGSIRLSYIGDQLSEDTDVKLKQLIGNMLGGVGYSIARVDALPKTPQGKHLQVSSDFIPS